MWHIRKYSREFVPVIDQLEKSAGKKMARGAGRPARVPVVITELPGRVSPYYSCMYSTRSSQLLQYSTRSRALVQCTVQYWLVIPSLVARRVPREEQAYQAHMAILSCCIPRRESVTEPRGSISAQGVNIQPIDEKRTAEKSKTSNSLDEGSNSTSMSTRQWEWNSELVEWHEHLGKGSFGVVHEVEVDGMRLAAKRIDLANSSSQQTARADLDGLLVFEFRAVRKVTHANCVEMFGVVVDNPSWACLLMELGDQGSLRQMLDKSPKRILGQPDVQIRLAHDVASGLAYCHAITPEPLLHHNIKPSNVLLFSSDAYGEARLTAKVSDVGFAVTLSASSSSAKASGRTKSDSNSGNLAYRAPEMFTGTYTTASEVYAYAFVVYVLLTGLRPWNRDENGKLYLEAIVINQVVEKHQRPKLPSGVGRGATKALATLMSRSWKHEPEKRPTMQAILMKLAPLQPRMQLPKAKQLSKPSGGSQNLTNLSGSSKNLSGKDLSGKNLSSKNLSRPVESSPVESIPVESSKIVSSKTASSNQSSTGTGGSSTTMSDPGISRPLGRSSSCVAEGLRPSCPRPLWRSSSSVAEGLRPSWGSERSGGSELTASDVTGEACDVFISFRFGEAHVEALALKEVLEERQFKVFLSDVSPGGDLQAVIARALASCRLAVVLASHSYGRETNGLFDTSSELNFITGQRKNLILVRMIEPNASWAEPRTVEAFPPSTPSTPWMAGDPMPDILLEDVLAELAQPAEASFHRELSILQE